MADALIAFEGVTPIIPVYDLDQYGMRDFRILDPGGNELSFGEPMASTREG